jgi:predicted ATPase
LLLVGREDEANLLQRRWAKAQTGTGHAVVLVGEAGLGKSRLIAAFERQLGSASRSLLRLSCSPHYQDTPLYPLIRYFEAAAGFERTDTPAKKYSKLQRLLGNTLGLGEDETGALADLLSIPAPVEMQSRQTAQRTNELTFKAVLHHIEALASTAPLLAIVEDLHWADPTTSALLDALVSELEHFSTLLIISTRPAAASAGHDAIAQTDSTAVRRPCSSGRSLASGRWRRRRSPALLNALKVCPCASRSSFEAFLVPVRRMKMATSIGGFCRVPATRCLHH